MSVDLLLDTNVVIWLAAGDERARSIVPILEDDASTVTISVVTWIEVAIKHSARKLDLSVDLLRDAAREHGVLELPLQAGHASMLERLPLHHRDPFDRLLIAQAMSEDMTLASSDGAFASYRDLALHKV